MKIKLTPFQAHKERWRDCTACDLHKVRHQVVLARGKIPCDILFVGEAPGRSEDALGVPFIGPAGKLLDEIIESALFFSPEREDVRPLWADMRIAFTNLICCIPIDEDEKLDEPPHDSVMACRPRLMEFANIAKPKLIVKVGKHAQAYLEPGYRDSVRLPPCKRMEMVHPAFILRAVPAQQNVLTQRAIVTLRNAVEEL